MNGRVLAEVVGFRQQLLLLMPLGPLGQIGQGSRVTNTRRALTRPGGSGVARSRHGPAGPRHRWSRPDRNAEALSGAVRSPTPAMQRPRIEQPLVFGVRAIDGLLTIGERATDRHLRRQRRRQEHAAGLDRPGLAADVNVIALIGERGREVREFIERDLGPEGLARRWSWSRPPTSRPSSA